MALTVHIDFASCYKHNVEEFSWTLILEPNIWTAGKVGMNVMSDIMLLYTVCLLGGNSSKQFEPLIVTFYKLIK
jgi:hypothetical protein